MSRKIYLFLLLFCFGLIGCANSSENGKAQTVTGNGANVQPATPSPSAMPPKKRYVTGTVHGHQKCFKNEQNSYAIRLPRQYQDDSKLPILFFFDSQGEGDACLKRYAGLGDAYGLIMVGSTSSRNGMQFGQSLEIYDQLIEEMRSSINFDEQRIWLAGFSGGARVAAQIAQTRANIDGVLAVGAGYQPYQGDRFSYAGFAGDEDFNYIELRSLADNLAQQISGFAFFEFEGGHAWPDPEVLGRGLQFLSLRNMGQGKAQRQDSMIQAAQAQYKSEYHGPYNQARLQAAVNCQHALAGIPGTTDLSATIAAMNSSKDWAADTMLWAQEFALEEKLRNEYAAKIANGSLAEWKGYAATLWKSAKQKERRNAALYRRVLNFLSLNTYMNLGQAMQMSDWQNAERFQQIYALVDPENAEQAYRLAEIRAVQGKQNEAMIALQQAVALGFKDATRMESDQLLQSLHNLPGYKGLVEEVRLKSE